MFQAVACENGAIWQKKAWIAGKNWTVWKFEFFGKVIFWLGGGHGKMDVRPGLSNRVLHNFEHDQSRLASSHDAAN